MLKVIDLKERFGKQYRIVYEESYYAQYGKNARVADPWLQIMPCANGHIGPWGDDKLAACTRSAGRAATALKALPWVQIAQDGSDGVNAVFPLEHFEDVAAIMKPRQRRQVTLTQEQRSEIGQRLMRGRQVAHQAIVQIAPDERPGIFEGRDDSQVKAGAAVTKKGPASALYNRVG